jgi:hypothetical protein
MSEADNQVMECVRRFLEWHAGHADQPYTFRNSLESLKHLSESDIDSPDDVELWCEEVY